LVMFVPSVDRIVENPGRTGQAYVNSCNFFLASYPTLSVPAQRVGTDRLCAEIFSRVRGDGCLHSQTNEVRSLTTHPNPSSKVRTKGIYDYASLWPRPTRG